MTLPPPIAHLAPLIGTWRGRGHGEYPTIASFDYTDEFEIWAPPGKPFLQFVQRTWNADGQPMHTEAGFLRAPTPDTVEIVAALPTGQGEVGAGTCEADADGVRLETDAGVRCTPTAKQVDRIVRRIRLEGDRLRYEMLMEAVGQGLTLHLTSELERG